MMHSIFKSKSEVALATLALILITTTIKYKSWFPHQQSVRENIKTFIKLNMKNFA